jgi:hypothetical protein
VGLSLRQKLQHDLAKSLRRLFEHRMRGAGNYRGLRPGQTSYAGFAYPFIFGEKRFQKKMVHRVKPGDDDPRIDRPSFFAGRRQVPPEFGWIATISKPIFRASIKLKPLSAKIWSHGIWSQP